MAVGERLRELRAMLGETQRSMSDRYDLGENTWQNYEREDRLPKIEVLEKLCEEGFSIDYLIRGRGSLVFPGASFVSRVRGGGTQLNYVWSTTRDAPTASPVAEKPPGFVLIPRFDVAASAGAGALVNDEHIVDFIAFKQDWLRRALGLAPDGLAVISAVGDSMQPTIRSGDLLLIDVSIKRVRDNAIYALRSGDMLLVKRLQMLARGAVRILSDNDAYGPEEVPPAEVPDLDIVGRVVWHGGLL